MYIESIELKNFRNYQDLQLDFDKGTNIFYGDNAQGKTNILESVYICGTTKSHKGSKDKEIIRFGEEESHIRMMVKKDELSYKIDMHLRKNKACQTIPRWNMQSCPLQTIPRSVLPSPHIIKLRRPAPVMLR